MRVHKKVGFIVVGVLFWANLAAAQQPAGVEMDKGALSWIDIYASLLFSTNENFRGATFYDKPILFPGVSFAFFEQRLNIRGPRADYRQKLLNGLELRANLALIRDDVLLELFGNQDPLQQQRPTALEASLGLSYKPNRFVELTGSFSQELITHFGQYGEATIFLPGLFVPGKNGPPTLIGKTFFRVGLASGDHNRFLYGPSAKPGFTHLETGLNFVSPRGFFGITPVVIGKYYRVLNRTNRNAIYVAEKNDGVGLFLVLSYRLPV